MSDWHEVNKHQKYFETELSKNQSKFHNWFCLKMISLCKTFKQWKADEQINRRDWD